MKTLDSHGAPGELLRRLESLRLETKALWGKMNAHQMVCHLTDAFGLAMGVRRASEKITPLSRSLVKWLALHAPLQWPKAVPTRPEMDQFDGGTRPGDFARDLDTLRAVIREFAQEPRQYSFGRHPVFGRLTQWEWMRWGYLHTDHHLRQFGR